MELPTQPERDALLAAAEVGDLEAVKKLLAARVDLVHSTDKVCFTHCRQPWFDRLHR
jgi:hypothetical protein